MVTRTRPATFDDLASLEGAEKVWRCSVDGLNYSVKVCDHEGITPPCGWWIRIPLPSDTDGAVEVRVPNLLAVKEEE